MNTIDESNKNLPTQPVIQINENELLDAMIERLRQCDGDDLMHYAEIMLGGEVAQHDDMYHFTPNENYTSAFDYKN